MSLRHMIGAAGMGRVLDSTDVKLCALLNDPKLVLDKTFMMNIFETSHNKNPPFSKYWELMFHPKQMKVVQKDGSKVLHYAHFLKYLFEPTHHTDINTTEGVCVLTKVAVKGIITEIFDPNKAAYKYLLSSGSEHSFLHFTNERKMALLGIVSTNYKTKSILGGTLKKIRGTVKKHLQCCRYF